MDAGMTLLESRAVTTAVKVSYDAAIKSFVTTMGLASLVAVGVSELDELVVQYFEKCFFAGDHASRGEIVMAAIINARPAFGRLRNLKLPRAWRSLKEWRKLTPSRTRIPLSLMVGFTITNSMCILGHAMMALWVLVAVSSYLRPGQMFSLTVGQLLEPVKGMTASWALRMHPEEKGVPSKTGEYDLSLLLDSLWATWMGAAFATIKTRPATAKIWDFTYMQLLATFHTALARLGLRNVVLYMTRHSGASIDRMTQERSSEEVRRRGGWKHPKSVARYEKHARLIDSLARLPGGLRRHMEEVEGSVEAIVLKGKVVAIPPLGALLAD